MYIKRFISFVSDCAFCAPPFMFPKFTIKWATRVDFTTRTTCIHSEEKMKKAIQKIRDFVKPVPMRTPQRREEEREVAGEETSEVAKDYLESLK